MISNKHFARNYHMANKKRETTKEKPRSKGLKIRQIDDYLRFALFLAVIGMFYIWNSHYAVKQVRKMEVLQKEAKSLKSKYLMKQSTLSAVMSLAEINEMVDSVGLVRSKEPLYKLVINEAEETFHNKKREMIKDTLMKDSTGMNSEGELPLAKIE